MNKKQRFAKWVGIIAIPILLIVAVKTRDPYERFWAWVFAAGMIFAVLLGEFIQKKEKCRKEQDMRQSEIIFILALIATGIFVFLKGAWDMWRLSDIWGTFYFVAIAIAYLCWGLFGILKVQKKKAGEE